MMNHIREKTPRLPFHGSMTIEQDNVREYEVKTYDIHEILRNDGTCPINLNTLQYMIRSQASLHRAENHEDHKRLSSLLSSRSNSIRGFVMYAKGAGPVAYSIYYPMIDNQGKRVAYCEDFFIAESFRGYGVGKILFHELAKRTLNDGAEYLQWATDKRNAPVIGFLEHIGAKHPNIITVSATKLLNEDISVDHILSNGWSQANFITRPITASDLWALERVDGLTPNFIRQTGDMNFKGFVTYEKGINHKPAAITPGWVHFSTFQLQVGLHMEDTIFANVQENQKSAIIASVIEATKKHAKRNDYPYLRWHVAKDNDLMVEILKGHFGLENDSMLGTPQSELIVYTLKNGTLKGLADSTPSKIIRASNNDSIGGRQRLPVIA